VAPNQRGSGGPCGLSEARSHGAEPCVAEAAQRAELGGWGRHGELDGLANRAWRAATLAREGPHQGKRAQGYYRVGRPPRTHSDIAEMKEEQLMGVGKARV
jgi:hypothetical protein